MGERVKSKNLVYILIFAFFISNAGAEFPDRPINMVIPYGPGGASDISARTLAEPLIRAVGQPLVMTNVTGAAGAKGAVVVSNSEPDGYTMLFARVGSHSVSPAMKAILPYRIEDFRFIGVYELNPVACAVSSDSDITSIEQLVERVKNEKLSYSSSGIGSLLHLAGAMVLHDFGIENPVEAVNHIPLRGGGTAVTAVINGTANFICTNVSAITSFVANDLLRPLLVTTPHRIEGLDAPTVAELGHPGLERLIGWTGLAGPIDISDEVADTWTLWMEEAVANETFVKTMESRGSIIQLMDPDESTEFIYTQYRTFRALVDELGMRIN